MLALPLFLTLSAPAELVPRGRPVAVAVARARIIAGARIDFRKPGALPPGARVQNGLVVFE